MARMDGKELFVIQKFCEFRKIKLTNLTRCAPGEFENMRHFYITDPDGSKRSFAICDVAHSSVCGVFEIVGYVAINATGDSLEALLR